MNQSTKELQKERNQIYYDLSRNIIPKRLPASFSLPPHMVAEYGNIDPIEHCFNPAAGDKAAEELCDLIYSDTCPVYPVGIISRPAQFYQILKSRTFVMGTNGFVQHPETSGMTETEYADFTEDPYAFILEKVIPRLYRALDPSDPVRASLALQAAKSELDMMFQKSVPIVSKMTEKHGYFNGGVKGSSGFISAPYDFIADQLRSFSGVSIDLRRHRSQLKEACKAVMPLMFHWGMPSNPDPQGKVGAPLHMPPYMNEKDFAEIWLPTFKTMTQQYAALGIKSSGFCEQDWMRYLDYLMDFPAGMQWMFEYGDAGVIKEKLGKKFVLCGLYPISLIKMGTRQQCIDKAKELLDIMMPGGGYLFAFDKDPLTLKDINLENYIAVTEFIRDYAVYQNAGESFGMKTNSEGFKYDEKLIGPLKSKYLFDWDEYKTDYPLTPDSARTDREQQKEIMNFYLHLLT